MNETSLGLRFYLRVNETSLVMSLFVNETSLGFFVSNYGLNSI